MIGVPHPEPRLRETKPRLRRAALWIAADLTIAAVAGCKSSTPPPATEPTTQPQSPDLGMKYDIPLKRGVSALTVLEPSGKLVHSQRAGEFENMSRISVQSVTDFLNRWKA